MWSTLVPGLARGGEPLLLPREKRECWLVGWLCLWMGCGWSRRAEGWRWGWSEAEDGMRGRVRRLFLWLCYME